MRNKPLLLIALGFVLCAVCIVIGGKTANLPEEGTLQKRSAGESTHRLERERRRVGGTMPSRVKPAIFSADRGLLVKALHAAADAEGDEDLARLVSMHAEGGYPQVMAAIRDSTEFGPARERILVALVRCWAANDPDSALDWAAGLPEWQREETYRRVCLDAAARYPDKAMVAALRVEDEASRAELAENIADTWAENDLPGLLNWARVMPQGGLRDRLFARAATALADKDPQAAVALMLEEIPAMDLQEQVALSIVHKWALRDPVEAARWVAAFPASGLREKARSELAGTTRHMELMRAGKPAE